MASVLPNVLIQHLLTLLLERDNVNQGALKVYGLNHNHAGVYRLVSQAILEET